jgi:uncharacterized protein involved in response to NO
MLLWLLMIQGILPLNSERLAGTIWHAHEMVWGFGTAAIAGFLLTAVPEFTSSAEFAPRETLLLVAFWLLARLFGMAGIAGLSGSVWVVAATVANLALIGWLAWRVGTRVWMQTGRRHVAFSLALAALTLIEAGFWVELLNGANPLRWINALVGLMMIMIVLAQSRISMRFLRGLLQPLGVYEEDYRATPPRRRLVILCIILVTIAEWLRINPLTLAWLAFAAGAAILAMMADWHFGRALLHRWVWPMYAVYACMAAGYILLGCAWMGAGWSASGARHVLTVGCMGLAVLMVMNIAGRVHAGRQLDDRSWRMWATVLLLAAVSARVLASSVHAPGGVQLWWWVAGLGWCAAWVLFLAHAWGHLAGPRLDGGKGCEEIPEATLMRSPPPRADFQAVPAGVEGSLPHSAQPPA